MIVWDKLTIANANDSTGITITPVQYDSTSYLDINHGLSIAGSIRNSQDGEAIAFESPVYINESLTLPVGSTGITLAGGDIVGTSSAVVAKSVQANGFTATPTQTGATILRIAPNTGTSHYSWFATYNTSSGVLNTSAINTSALQVSGNVTIDQNLSVAQNASVTNLLSAGRISTTVYHTPYQDCYQQDVGLQIWQLFSQKIRWTAVTIGPVLILSFCSDEALNWNPTYYYVTPPVNFKTNRTTLIYSNVTVKQGTILDPSYHFHGYISEVVYNAQNELTEIRFVVDNAYPSGQLCATLMFVNVPNTQSSWPTEFPL